MHPLTPHAHADQHIREIVLAAKVRQRWSGELTVLRPPGSTQELVWHRRLSPREISLVAGHFAAPPALGEVDIDGGVVDVYHDGIAWRIRAVNLEA